MATRYAVTTKVRLMPVVLLGDGQRRREIAWNSGVRISPARSTAAGHPRIVAQACRLCLSASRTIRKLLVSRRCGPGRPARGSPAFARAVTARGNRRGAERFVLDVPLDALGPVLAADPGVLVPAERSTRIERVHVHRVRAGPDLRRDLDGLCVIRGPHAAGQAVYRIVGDPDGVLFVS